MSDSLRERFPTLYQILAGYFMGDFSLDEEVAQMVGSLQRSHLDQFGSEVRELLNDEAVSEDDLDAFIRGAVNWDFGGGRATLEELLGRVESADHTDTHDGFDASD